MTPSILTIAQEGLRLAEKATPDSWLSDNRINFERHACTHYADICRELLRLREVIRGVLDSATPNPIEHPNMFQAFAAARAAMSNPEKQ